MLEGMEKYNWPKFFVLSIIVIVGAMAGAMKAHYSAYDTSALTMGAWSAWAWGYFTSNNKGNQQ